MIATAIAARVAAAMEAAAIRTQRRLREIARAGAAGISPEGEKSDESSCSSRSSGVKRSNSAHRSTSSLYRGRLVTPSLPANQRKAGDPDAPRKIGIPNASPFDVGGQKLAECWQVLQLRCTTQAKCYTFVVQCTPAKKQNRHCHTKFNEALRCTRSSRKQSSPGNGSAARIDGLRRRRRVPHKRCRLLN